MAQTIIVTQSEVIKFTSFDKKGSPCKFNNRFNIEYYEFRKCLGLEFRKALIELLADYSEVESYTAGTYPINTLREFKGTIWITTEETDKQPGLKTGWAYAPKFTDEEVEDFYCNFLGPYLAHCILYDELPMIWTQPTDNGIIQFNNNEYKQGDDTAFTRLQKAIAKRKAKIFGNMDAWLTSDDVKDTEPFDKYKVNLEAADECKKDESCLNQKKRKFHYNFG